MHPQLFLESLRENPLEPAFDAKERMKGLAVLGITFESGHVLALRTFEQTSSGHGFTAVWMREPNGDWRFFSDNPPSRSCAKYMIPDMADQVPIGIRWIDARTLNVTIPALRFRWLIEFEETRRSRWMSAAVSRVPRAVLRSGAGSTAVAFVASRLLRTGTLRLHGEVPNGQWFTGLPEAVWRVSRSTASASSFEFGEMVVPGEQARFGDFWLPARPIAMAGMVEFTPIPAVISTSERVDAAA